MAGTIVAIVDLNATVVSTRAKSNAKRSAMYTSAWSMNGTNDRVEMRRVGRATLVSTKAGRLATKPGWLCAVLLVHTSFVMYPGLPG